jgi:hypothetical protein
MVAAAPAPHHLIESPIAFGHGAGRSGPAPIFADRYRLDRLLEQADRAAVFTATDLRLRRTVSIKILDPALALRASSPEVDHELERRRHPPTAHAKQLQILDAGITARGTPYEVTEPAAPLTV